MLLVDHAERMGEVADREPITVRADLDQEEIAETFADYDLLALPVIDGDGMLVGQVTVDDIIDVIHQEATEDNLKMGATSSQEMEERSVGGIMRRRLPWLLFCLMGTVVVRCRARPVLRDAGNTEYAGVVCADHHGHGW